MTVSPTGHPPLRPIGQTSPGRLALSILQHRDFCTECRPHIEDAVLALLGANVTEVLERGV